MQGKLLKVQFNVALLDCVTAAWELALEVLLERRHRELHNLVPPCKALAEIGSPALQLVTQASDFGIALNLFTNVHACTCSYNVYRAVPTALIFTGGVEVLGLAQILNRCLP